MNFPVRNSREILSPMLKSFKFHHIGYAVKDIPATAAYYAEAGWSVGDVVEDPIQNVRIAFLTRRDTPLIELVAPVDDHSPVVQTLQKSGVSPYHVCYEVEDMQEAVRALRRKRYVPLFKPVPAVALGNRLICYLYNSEVGLIELLQ